MKLIDDRIKYLLQEKEIILKEFPQESPEMQIMYSMVNIRIAIELKFLSDLVAEIPKTIKPTDKEIDDFFPLTSKGLLPKEQHIKRNAVKLFIKNKL